MVVVYFFLSLLARIPMPALRALGSVLGTGVYWVNKKRRHVTRVNLGIAFPELSAKTKERLVKQHLRTMGMALADRIWLWFAPLNVVYSRISLSGFEHLPTTNPNNNDHNNDINHDINNNNDINNDGESIRPVILLIPHFAGLEAAGPAWVGECLKRGVAAPSFTTIFQPQRTTWEDALFRRGRGRYADLTQFTRRDGIRPVIKSMRQGRHYYCLPDNDFGAKDAVFVPFFGTLAATVTVLPKLSAMMDAPVIPLLTRMTPQGYHVTAMAPMLGMGQNSLDNDCSTMNAAIEAWVRTMPEQYLFSHRRYKTRPEGQANLYA